MPRRFALCCALVVAVIAAGCSGDRPTLADSAVKPTTTSTTRATTSTTSSTRPATTPTTAAASSSTTRPVRPTGPTLVATVKPGLQSVQVFPGPDGATAQQSVENPGEYGQPQTFVVTEQEEGWVKVQLPVRPNGSTGWVRESDVTLATHDYRIEVSLSGHRFELFKGTERLVDAPAGIGTDDTPTPGGVYYTWVLIDPTNSGYGAYAYGLSGFSEKLSSFGGGDGRLGIHGTNDPTSIGKDVSHGCVRIGNDVVTELVEKIGLPLGVPVYVSA